MFPMIKMDDIKSKKNVAHYLLRAQYKVTYHSFINFNIILYKRQLADTHVNQNQLTQKQL